MSRIALTFFLLAPFSFPQSRTSCEVTGAAAEAVRALPPMTDLSRSWEERMAPRRALARKEPGNWPLQFVLQDPILRYFYIGQEWDEAIARYRSLPDRTLGEVLEARLIAPLHRKRSREMLRRALAAAPDSPWVHLSLLEWAANPVQGDAAMTATHFEQYRLLCPDSTRAFQHVGAVQDPVKLGRHVQALRRLIEGRKKAGLRVEDLGLFRPAWTWERVIAGESGRDAFTQTVRSDLAAVRRLSLYDTPEWYSILQFGFDTTLQDQAALEILRKEILEAAPTSQAAWWIEEEKAMRGLRPDAPPGEMQAFQKRTMAEAAERVKRFGDRPFVRFRIHMLVSNPDSSIDNAELLRLTDLLLTLAERYPEQGSSWPPVQMLIAEQYTRRKLMLHRVPSLVELGLQQIELQEKHRRDSDAFPKTSNFVDNIALTQTRAREILIRHAIATGQTERAKTLLSEYRRMLETSKPADNSAQASGRWKHNQSTYLELMKAAGLEALPVAEVLPPAPESAERYPVASFEARDLDGRDWSLAALKGKVVYVNVWTTWCVPCRAEMPGLQKLHDLWKDRKDRAVLTISADVHPDLARNFIREHKYTFPVVHGRDIAEKFFPPAYFPQNWIVDPLGRRLDIPAPRAYETTMEQIEQLAVKVAGRR